MIGWQKNNLEKFLKVYIGIHDTYDYDKVDPLPSAFPTKYITLVAKPCKEMLNKQELLYHIT